MTGATPECTELLNRAFDDEPLRESRAWFVNTDSSIVVDEGISVRVPGDATAWPARIRGGLPPVSELDGDHRRSGTSGAAGAT